jgi:WD40 repeat protein
VCPPILRVLLVGYLLLCTTDADAAEPGPSKAPAPRTDLYGDPLPNGAIARLGSIRLRHAGLSDFVFLPGGQTVLSAGSDSVLRFWDIASGRQTRAVRLQGSAGQGGVVSLSPDGKTLAAGDKERLVFWDVATGKEIKTLPGPKNHLAYLHFAPDGKNLAVGAWGAKASLWDWRQGKERPVPLPARKIGKIGMDSSFHACFSPDGKWLVAGGGWGEALYVYELATGREVRRLRCDAFTSTVSADSKRLAVATLTNDKRVQETVLRLFDLPAGKEVAQFPLGTKQPYYTLALSPDGNTLACSSFSDRSFLLSCTTGRELHRLAGSWRSMTFSPDGETLAACEGPCLRLWDVVTGKERYDQASAIDANPALAASRDSRLLATGSWTDPEVSLWDTARGRLLRRLPLKGKRWCVCNLAFSSDGQTLFASHYKGFFQFWDIATGRELRTAQLRAKPNPPPGGGGEPVSFGQMHIAADGKHVSTVDRVWRPADPTPLALWEIATGKPVSQHFLPPGSWHGTWLTDGAAIAVPWGEGLTLIDVRTGAVRSRIAGTSPDGPLAASPDDRLVAALRAPVGSPQAGAKDEHTTVGVWEVATGKQVVEVATGHVAHLALAPDSRSLVATDKGFVRVWDLATGKERRRWPLPEALNDSAGNSFVNALVVLPDGRRALTVLADGTALVWDLAPALAAGEPLVKAAAEKEIAAWWADLAGADAARAYAAVWRLAEVPPESAVAFLRRHLRPIAEADFKEVRQHITDLGSDKFKIREQAFQQLASLGVVAVPALRQALAKDQPLEVRRRLETILARPTAHLSTPAALRHLRAIQVLERIASKEARRLLAELAEGMAYAAETQEAQRALARLSLRAAMP